MLTLFSDRPATVRLSLSSNSDSLNFRASVDVRNDGSIEATESSLAKDVILQVTPQGVPVMVTTSDLADPIARDAFGTVNSAFSLSATNFTEPAPTRLQWQMRAAQVPGIAAGRILPRYGQRIVPWLFVGNYTTRWVYETGSSSNSFQQVRSEVWSNFTGTWPPGAMSTGLVDTVASLHAIRDAVVEITVDGSGYGNSSVSIDLGDDGSIEATKGSGVVRAIVRVTKAGYPIRILTEASIPAATANGRLAARGMAQLSYRVLANCAAATYGSLCGTNPTLALVGPAAPRDYTVMMEGVAAGAPVAFTFGERKMDLPLALSNCRLYTDALVSYLGVADAQGEAVLHLRVPQGYAGDLTTQGLHLEGQGPSQRLGATPGMLIRCWNH